MADPGSVGGAQALAGHDDEDAGRVGQQADADDLVGRPVEREQVGVAVLEPGVTGGQVTGVIKGVTRNIAVCDVIPAPAVREASDA